MHRRYSPVVIIINIVPRSTDTSTIDSFVVTVRTTERASVAIDYAARRNADVSRLPVLPADIDFLQDRGNRFHSGNPTRPSSTINMAAIWKSITLLVNFELAMAYIGQCQWPWCYHYIVYEPYSLLISQH